MSTDEMSAGAPAVCQHPIAVSRNVCSGKIPRSRSLLSVARLFLGMAAALLALDHAVAADMTILNVSYDPTREFYEAFNKAFADHWHLETGEQITIEQSHGGSGTQARAVMNGLDADVVTLGIASDIEALAKAGLIAKNWQSRLPDDSCPYTSTIVFLVRKGNPKGIRDWSDLERADVGVVTPNPKTSSGGRWSFLAAWGWALDHWGGDESKARDFVAKIYKQAPVLEAGARGATIDFTRRGIGDVLLSWENEAMLAVRENGSGQFEIVRPGRKHPGGTAGDSGRQDCRCARYARRSRRLSELSVQRCRPGTGRQELLPAQIGKCRGAPCR